MVFRRLRSSTKLSRPIEPRKIQRMFFVEEDGTALLLTFELAQPQDQRGLSDATRGGEEGVGAVRQVPLETGEIAGAVEEVVGFDRRAGDVSHRPESSTARFIQ